MKKSPELREIIHKKFKENKVRGKINLINKGLHYIEEYEIEEQNGIKECAVTTILGDKYKFPIGKVLGFNCVQYRYEVLPNEYVSQLFIYNN